MQIVKYPGEKYWPVLLARPDFGASAIDQSVHEILTSVKKDGDKALFNLAKKLDGAKLQQLKVSEEEIGQAETDLSPELQEAIKQAARNIRIFHETQEESPQMVETMPGVVCWRKSVAIQDVGLYVPGGSAPLFSTVLMLAIPARIAGCRRVVLCTPPSKSGQIHPAILFAAKISGVTEIYKTGGAQAIAAMAFGTETITRVSKIFGPGNRYVTLAKQLVSSMGVAIDIPAGPSEVAIISDEHANPEFVAADLLAQAEHGPDSQVVLFSDSLACLEKTERALQMQLKALPRLDIAGRALENSRFILCKNLDQAMEMSNFYAPEHLIINCKNAEDLSPKVINAGSVFIGPYTPEAAGDYASGTNHTLPTNGYASSFSGVSLDSFVRKITFQKISREGLQKLGPVIKTMADAEELQGHKKSVSIRLK